MTKPIAPTPHLNAEESERFLALVEDGLKHPCGPVPISVSNDLIHRQHKIKVENAGEILWKELCANDHTTMDENLVGQAPAL